MPPSLKALKSFFAKSAEEMPLTYKSLKNPIPGKPRLALAPKDRPRSNLKTKLSVIPSKRAPYTKAQRLADDAEREATSREVEASLAQRGLKMTPAGKIEKLVRQESDPRSVVTMRKADKLEPGERLPPPPSSANQRRLDLQDAQQAARVGMHDRAKRLFNQHGIAYDDPRKGAKQRAALDQKEMDAAYANRVRAQTARGKLDALKKQLSSVDDVDELDRLIRHTSGELKLGVQGSLRRDGRVEVWDHNAGNGNAIWSHDITSQKMPKKKR